MERPIEVVAAPPERLTRLRAGDGLAWRVLMKEHGPSLLGYATRMLGSRSDAEEVVQLSLVAAYRGTDGYEGRASLKNWLFRIVRNRALDVIRARRRFVDVGRGDADDGSFDIDGRWLDDGPPSDELAAERIDQARLVERVRAEIDRLPHDYREVILLRDVHGLDGDEIGDVLGITANNVRVRLHRARKVLRAAIVAGSP